MQNTVLRMIVLFSIYIQSGHFLSNIFNTASDPTLSEDAGIESRTVASFALIVRRSKHLARSHPQGHNNKDEQF